MREVSLENVTSGAAGDCANVPALMIANAAATTLRGPTGRGRRFLTMTLSSSANVRHVYTPGGGPVHSVKRRLFIVLLSASASVAAGCSKPAKYDVVIRHGTVYDGTGAPGKTADVAILDDRIAAIGDLSAERGRDEVDA